MAKIKCLIHSHSRAGIHVEQIYTGFFMLHRADLVRVTQNTGFKYKWSTHLRVILNDKIKLHYDVFDGSKIDADYLDEADFYFKRSYSLNHLQAYGENQKKVHPFGLNYEVYPSCIDKFALKRAIILRRKTKKIPAIIRALNIPNHKLFTPRVNNMQSLPDYEAKPKILFMARAYETNKSPEIPSEEAIFLKNINEMRADCIRLLRKEFGDRFYGGFIHTDFAIKNYPDLLMPHKTIALKGNYINLLKSYPICVATTGLHGSIGWKFAEYVAFSKAIISEELNFELPGGIEKGINYLGFSTPEGCLNEAIRVYRDKEIRNNLMMNNWRYYQSNLKPDSLILNTLATALREAYG